MFSSIWHGRAHRAMHMRRVSSIHFYFALFWFSASIRNGNCHTMQPNTKFYVLCSRFASFNGLRTAVADCHVTKTIGLIIFRNSVDRFVLAKSVAIDTQPDELFECDWIWIDDAWRLISVRAIFGNEQIVRDADNNTVEQNKIKTNGRSVTLQRTRSAIRAYYGRRCTVVAGSFIFFDRIRYICTRFSLQRRRRRRRHLFCFVHVHVRSRCRWKRRSYGSYVCTNRRMEFNAKNEFRTLDDKWSLWSCCLCRVSMGLFLRSVVRCALTTFVRSFLRFLCVFYSILFCFVLCCRLSRRVAAGSMTFCERVEFCI